MEGRGGSDKRTDKISGKKPKVMLLISVLLTVLPSAAAASWQDADDAAHNWALRHYRTVLEAVLP
jgi:hypothetical protein